MSIDIFFNNPDGVVYPGGLLSGMVTLTVNEPIKAHSISIFIDGGAHTSWDESKSESDGKGGSKSSSTDYRASIIYAKGEAVVWSSTKENNKIPVGQMQFPFQFVLPPDCPPSFEGFYGFIRYQVIVKIDRVWNFNKANRRFFTVAPTFDLNRMSQAIEPIRKAFTQNTGIILSRNGKVTVEMQIRKQGFVPGETMVVDVLIDNQSSKHIKKCELRVHQLSKYFASEFGWKAIHSHEIQSEFAKHSYDQKIQDRKLTTFEQQLDIAPKQQCSMQLAIVIPPTVSSFNICPIITVDYFVKVKVTTKSSFNNTIHCDAPILIGTVPLRMAQVIVPNAPPQSQQLYPMVPGSSSSNGTVIDEDIQLEGITTEHCAKQAELHPPSYEESVYGVAGTTKDTLNAMDFAPRYPYYSNLPSAPPDE